MCIYDIKNWVIYTGLPVGLNRDGRGGGGVPEGEPWSARTSMAGEQATCMDLALRGGLPGGVAGGGVHTSKGAAGDAGLWRSRDLAGSAWGLRHVPRAGEVRPAETRCPLCVACSRGPGLAVRSTAPRGSRCDLRCPRSSRCAKRAAEGPGQRFAFSCFVRGRGDVS